MSALSYLFPDVMNYLYDNNLKIQIYENGNRGFWAFLQKFDDRGYVSQIHYYIKKNKLYVRWSGIKHNQRISAIILLYFLFIYDGIYDKILLKDGVHSERNDDENDTDKKCFLCVDNECIICECEKNKINIIDKIIELYTNKNIKDILHICEKRKKNIQNYQNIRKYLNKNYNLIAQEHINFIDPDLHISGYLRFGKNNVDFTNTIKNVHIMIRECVSFDTIKLIILHLISYENVKNVMIRFPKKNIDLYDYFNNLGFILPEENESFYANFFGFELDIETITLKKSYI